jgi:hypothetical protein
MRDCDLKTKKERSTNVIIRQRFIISITTIISTTHTTGEATRERRNRIVTPKNFIVVSLGAVFGK